MEDRAHTDLVGFSVSMVDKGEELDIPLDRWIENRSCWVTDKVYRNVKERRQENKEYIKKMVVIGVTDAKTEITKI